MKYKAEQGMHETGEKVITSCSQYVQIYHFLGAADVSLKEVVEDGYEPQKIQAVQIVNSPSKVVH